MEIIKPSAEILHVSHPQPLLFTEQIARTCYRSHDKTKPGSAERMTRMLLESGHHGMLEFVDVIAEFTTDRAISHQLVRHRPCSYAQESQRWIRYHCGVRFIEPEGYDHDDPAWQVWERHMQFSEDAYLEMLAYGKTAQQSRKVLPNSAATVVVMKANMREWMHFFKLRTAKDADPDMQQLAGSLKEKFRAVIPILFD